MSSISLSFARNFRAIRNGESVQTRVGCAFRMPASHFPDARRYAIHVNGQVSYVARAADALRALLPVRF